MTARVGLDESVVDQLEVGELGISRRRRGGGKNGESTTLQKGTAR